MTMFWSITRGSSGTGEAAARAEGAARRAGTEVADLEGRLDRTLLACEAMWTLLRDKLDVTDEQLIDRINKIDLSDGQLDGKARKTPVSCPSCGRTMARRFPKCMYCGQAVVHDPFA